MLGVRYGAAESVCVGVGIVRRQHEVVADRRVGVGVILRGERVLIREPVKVRHRRAADDLRVIGIFFHDDDDVADRWNRPTPPPPSPPAYPPPPPTPPAPIVRRSPIPENTPRTARPFSLAPRVGSR